MKKLILTLVGVIFIITSLFSQSFIGKDKKYIIDNIKEKAVKVNKPETMGDDGSYSIKVNFENNTNIYSFTKSDLCFFYIVIERYSYENYSESVKYMDERYLRVFPNRKITDEQYDKDIWKEPFGSKTFVYWWVVININTNVMCTVYLMKENYENNKITYLQSFLGSN